ncbi:MAG TPA: endonuclease/exonuclease/phosphatase family protein [Candidatus Omnitrophota bacterium]|nr:endonuclease/exonuclease/phosphatase family protein [Candidatus Omnitrophota bacterium]
MIILRQKKSPQHNNRNYTHPQEPRYADLHLAKVSPHPGNTLKVVSYNIEYSKKISQAVKLLQTHEDLKNADVICLQEMTLEAVRTIGEALKYNYVYYPALLHPVLAKDFGNAILSKWPIVHDQKILLPHSNPKSSQRVAVISTIYFQNKPVVITCVHLKVLIKPSFRKEQITKLLKNLPLEELPIIIAGDFNTFTKANNQAISDPLIKADFIPATDGLGWSHKHWTLLNKKSQLDHIFIKGLEIVKTGKVINRKSSDHIPIWAELAFSSDS